jgi:hypothetical protein
MRISVEFLCAASSISVAHPSGVAMTDRAELDPPFARPGESDGRGKPFESGASRIRSNHSTAATILKEIFAQSEVVEGNALNAVGGSPKREAIAKSGELALELLQEVRVAITGRREFDAPVARPSESDSYGKAFEVGCFAQALEPFDRRDSVREQVIAQAEVVEGDALEAVEIDVKEREAAAMLLDHGEGRAEDVIFSDIEAAGETLDEAGFADTEIAGESDQFATLQI